MSLTKKKLRKKYIPKATDINELINEAHKKFEYGDYFEAFDVYEFVVDNFPQYSVPVLADLYEKYQGLPKKDRYTLYQGRIFDFEIKPGDKVLDVGSGHKPFPYATALSDISTTDNYYGRAGVPFKHLNGLPVYEFNVEKIPFEDKEFDFVYCSHVLEHVDVPEKACSELQRIGKRGYIETPTKGKDIWLNSGKISNHKWFVENINDKLLFVEYDDGDDEGIGADILMNMHVAPQTEREKAYSALLYLKPHTINTMFYWEEKFECEVIRKKQNFTVNVNFNNKKEDVLIVSNEKNKSTETPTFMQIHTFYERYLVNFYSFSPELTAAPFEKQIEALVEDGFSGNHIIAPYMEKFGYQSIFVVANNVYSQKSWLNEKNIWIDENKNWLHEIVKKQIEYYKPDVLYLSDPITFDAKFLATLSYRPKFIIGWRASDIPVGTSFVGFDLFLSGLKATGEFALELGAKNYEFFFPGFPVKILNKISNVESKFDLSFVGSWTTAQHQKRNKLIEEICLFAEKTKSFYPRFYLSGETHLLPGVVRKYSGEERYGIKMYKGLKEGKIVFDARGEIRNLSNNVDIAKKETMNMRIFETTGVGSLLLTEYHENLSEFFEIGKEIDVFENEKELLEKIIFYKKNENIRREIAINGQKRCLKDYSMEKRAESLNKIIKKYFTLKNNNQWRIELNLDTQTIINELTSKIQNGKIDEAFEEIIRLKAKRQPIEKLDMLRAFCFIYKNDLVSAKEALLEELARFPNNEMAKSTLKNLSEVINEQLPEDEQFKEIYDKIKNHTMLSVERLYSLYFHAKQICEDDLEGNFVECGVARGGSSILLAIVIKKFSKSNRKLYSFDTFEGMPEPKEVDKHEGIEADKTGWGTGTCDGGLENLNKLSEKFGVTDIIIPVQGLFQETLPKIKEKVSSIALLHLDGDWYDSTKVVLENLYENVVENGFIQIDDYGYWEGCKKAVDEYALKRNLEFSLHKIDSTGVWMKKISKKKNNTQKSKTLVNLGCGNNWREGWINIDVVSNSPYVKAYDLRKGIPLENESADFVYSSHMLEHLGKREAENFIRECFRVLKKGGIIRIAVPDLETIAREYLKNLEAAKKGDEEAKKRYEWIMLELLDQTVRERSGGEMLKYWAQKEIPAYDYVIERVGSEAENAIAQIRASGYVPSEEEPQDPCEIGKFRLSGEIHKWMYDEFSLGELLKKAGFVNVKKVSAYESSCNEFLENNLDLTEDGKIRKPDSLFMEGVK